MFNSIQIYSTHEWRSPYLIIGPRPKCPGSSDQDTIVIGPTDATGHAWKLSMYLFLASSVSGSSEDALIDIPFSQSAAL